MDPFLLTHRVNNPLNNQLYDIGPHFSPISIRDQMIRGHAIVTRALREGTIGAGKPLLVVGAGVAGVTAAVIAADNEVKTTLIDRGKRPFALQLATQTRFIDPTQYDWPAAHWGKSVFPWAGTEHPLSWEANVSSAIAGTWENTLNDVIADTPTLEAMFGVELVEPPSLAKSAAKPIKGLTQVYLEQVSTKVRSGPHGYAMIISCTGAGPERVEVANYRSRKFWEDDPFSQPNLGLASFTLPRVYISGGGDGALQDFLRIVTKVESAKEIFAALPGSLQEEAARGIGGIEEHYQRAFMWSGTTVGGEHREDDHNIQATLHRKYVELIEAWLIKYKADLIEKLRPLLRDFLSDLTITLAYSCTHFTHCYALNHFLALLLARHIEVEYKKTILRPRTRTVNVRGLDGHACKKDPADCEEKAHEIRVITANCDTPRDAADDESIHRTLRNNYNVVIIRHGINWNAPLFGELPNSHRRHLLPYYLGWDATDAVSD